MPLAKIESKKCIIDVISNNFRPMGIGSSHGNFGRKTAIIIIKIAISIKSPIENVIRSAENKALTMLRINNARYKDLILLFSMIITPSK